MGFSVLVGTGFQKLESPVDGEDRMVLRLFVLMLSLCMLDREKESMSVLLSYRSRRCWDVLNTSFRALLPLNSVDGGVNGGEVPQ